jgi:hypothetical protein
VENVQDGWSIHFDKYIVTVGDIDLHLSTDESVVAEAGDVFVIDLTDVPGAGALLWSLDGLQAGRWELNYATAGR